jgi:transposase InsO family protein
VNDLASADFFVVPTATFQLLFVFVILSHDRRRPVHFAVTSHPSAEWTARQLVQAFPWDSAQRFLVRDRDGTYGNVFRETAARLGIQEVLCAPRSPWQNAYVERLIGSIRREWLDHVIILARIGPALDLEILFSTITLVPALICRWTKTRRFLEPFSLPHSEE